MNNNFSIYKRYLSVMAYLIIILNIPCQAQTSHSIAHNYLDFWQSNEYSAMYDMLSDQSKTHISRGEFIDKHRNFARKYIIDDFDILEIVNRGQTAAVYYRLELTRVGGGLETQSKYMCLIKEREQWKIDY